MSGLTMASGPTASTFDLTLTNLPMDAKNLLQSKHADGLRDHKPLHVKIFLGYFDEGATFSPPDPVMEGAIIRLHSEVNEGGVLETHISGQEIGGYRLRTKCKISYAQRGPATAVSFLQKVLQDTRVTLKDGHGLTTQLTNYNLARRQRPGRAGETRRWRAGAARHPRQSGLHKEHGRRPATPSRSARTRILCGWMTAPRATRILT